jgi:hypothetical protein
MNCNNLTEVMKVCGNNSCDCFSSPWETLSFLQIVFIVILFAFIILFIIKFFKLDKLKK